MTASSDVNSASDALGLSLRRLAWLAAIALLGLCCWLVWRISMVAYQTEAAIVAIADDVKRISSSGAQISDHLRELDQRLQSIESKAADAMNFDELAHLLDEVEALGDAEPSAARSPSPVAEREIKHLLAHIRNLPHRFVYSDENKGGLRFSFQLYAKFKAYDDVIASAEDFIDKVGTKSIGGHPYRVVINLEETVALSNWLTQELADYRKSAYESAHEE